MQKNVPAAIFKSRSPEDTASLAAAFAAALSGGEIILLEGPIGAGKTWFTRELARAIGVKRLPASASFGMMRAYKGSKIIGGKKFNLYHFDLFRAGEEDMENLGVEEFFGKEDGISLMEWSEAAGHLSSGIGYLKLSIELAGGDSRTIKAFCEGKKSENFLSKAEKIWRKGNIPLTLNPSPARGEGTLGNH